MKDEHHEKMSAEFGKLFSGVEKQAKNIYDAGKSETKKKLDETSGYQELKDEIVTLKYEINELKHEMEKLKGQRDGRPWACNKVCV
mgnify:CR=1 FL=1